MDSQTVNPTSVDTETVEQLENEIKKELLEILNKSQFSKILKKYGISNPAVLTVQSTLDLNQLQAVEQGNNNICVESFSTAVQPPVRRTTSVLIKPCPIDGDPDGCWVG